MGRTHTISARCSTAAPATIVWDVLTDVSMWPEWGPFDHGALDHAGRPHPSGLRPVRRTTHGRITTLEKVVAYEPERHFAYELHSARPLRDHMSEVHLSESDGTTHIDWRASYRVRVPGTAGSYQRRLSSFLDELVTALASEAERRSADV